MNLDENIISDFPNDGKIYLNNASVSITPLDCIRSMTNFLVTYGSIGPDSLDSEPFVTEKLRQIRKVISEIIKCQPNEIILTQSTTDGINAVASGLSFDPNSNIIIRGMGHEHHANYLPWLRLGNKIKIRSLKVDQNGFFEIQELNKLLDDNTKLVTLSHALYNTGAILPVTEVGEILEKKGIPYFLDSAQTIGCIGDFNVKSTKCDFMAFNGSKWLCGPMGTGIFYCSKNSSDLLKPIGIGGESAMIYEETKISYKDIPEKVGIAGLEASVNYLTQYGMQNIRKKIINLANQLREELAKISGITLYGPDDPDKRTSIISFNLHGHKPEEIVEKLEKQKIILSVREIFDKKIVRVSPHFFNNDLQIEKVIDEIKKL